MRKVLTLGRWKYNMTAQCTEVAIVLAGRNHIYQLLKHVFGQEPSVQLLEAITSDFTGEVLDIVLERECLEQYTALFAELRKAISADPERTLDRIKSEYVYLMLGPGKLPAPPWESVYVSKARLLFQESTLKVRQAYLEYSLLPEAYPHVADDHLSIEMDFMAQLGQLAQESLEKGELSQLEKILSDQKAFLDDHLLVWIGDFAQDIQSARTQYFYPHMASLASHIAHADRAAVDELLAAVKNQ